jgi:hypothetical protein
MSFRWIQSHDGGGDTVPADQEPTTVAAASNASKKSADSFTVQKFGINVVANGIYKFSFAYLYENPENVSELLIGPNSANFSFTLEAPDYTKPVTNLVVTPGLLLYGVKWDPIDKSLPANKWFIDAQIYESLTGAFTGEEYLVWNGTGNSATILVSNTNNRWIRVDTRDQDYHKKSVIYGPFKASDPIVVDTTGPGNVASVTTSGGLDTIGVVGFNGYANISWPAVTGDGIRGYRIRFRPVTNPVSSYSYADSPGTGTSYRLAGLGAGLVYEIAVATYDEYNNTSSSYVSGTNVTVGGTPYIASTVDVSGFFRAKANPTDADSTAFKFGYGIETGKRGLLFNASNYWHIDSSQSALFKVGGPTANYLLWDGAKLTVDGDINAKGGNFSGNIFMTTNGASIYNGTVDATTGNLTGNGFALNSTGLKVANGTNSVTIAAATGTITANAGSIGGWNLSGTTLSKNNVILDSAGQIQLGATAATAFYLNTGLVSDGFTWLAWAGNNVPDANAKFRIRSDGTLFVVGAQFGTGTTIAGYATTAQLTTTNTNLATTNTNLATTNTNLGTTNTAVATKLTKSAATITDSANNITAINSAGITVFSNGNASATGPGTGARVVMNSSGIAAYNALNSPTFSINASNGSAIFKGDITGASGEFSGAVRVTSGTKTALLSSNATLSLTDTSTSWLSGGGINITSGTKTMTLGAQAISFNNGLAGIFTDAAVAGYGADDLIIVTNSGSNIVLGGTGQTGRILINRAINGLSSSISSGFFSATPSDANSSVGLNPNGSIVARRFDGIPGWFGRYGTSGTAEAIRFMYAASTSATTMSDAGGINISTGTPSFRGPSDYRLKDNIEDYSGGLQKINMARVRSFIMKSDAERNTQIGFIAHEFSEPFPDFVQGEKDGVDENGDPEYQSVMTTNLIPYIVSAIQEISSQITTISTRLDVLES